MTFPEFHPVPPKYRARIEALAPPTDIASAGAWVRSVATIADEFHADDTIETSAPAGNHRIMALWNTALRGAVRAATLPTTDPARTTAEAWALVLDSVPTSAFVRGPLSWPGAYHGAVVGRALPGSASGFRLAGMLADAGGLRALGFVSGTMSGEEAHRNQGWSSLRGAIEGPGSPFAPRGTYGSEYRSTVLSLASTQTDPGAALDVEFALRLDTTVGLILPESGPAPIYPALSAESLIGRRVSPAEIHAFISDSGACSEGIATLCRNHDIEYHGGESAYECDSCGQSVEYDDDDASVEVEPFTITGAMLDDIDDAGYTDAFHEALDYDPAEETIAEWWAENGDIPEALAKLAPPDGTVPAAWVGFDADAWAFEPDYDAPEWGDTDDMARGDILRVVAAVLEPTVRAWVARGLLPPVGGTLSRRTATGAAPVPHDDADAWYWNPADRTLRWCARSTIGAAPVLEFFHPHGTKLSVGPGEKLRAMLRDGSTPADVRRFRATVPLATFDATDARMLRHRGEPTYTLDSTALAQSLEWERIDMLPDAPTTDAPTDAPTDTTDAPTDTTDASTDTTDASTPDAPTTDGGDTDAS